MPRDWVSTRRADHCGEAPGNSALSRHPRHHGSYPTSLARIVSEVPHTIFSYEITKFSYEDCPSNYLAGVQTYYFVIRTYESTDRTEVFATSSSVWCLEMMTEDTLPYGFAEIS